MTDKPDRGISSGGNPPGLRKADTDLARSYRHAAAGDAHHERKSGGPDPAGSDPTLATTFERPHKPLSDVTRPDKADGENKGYTSGDPAHDKIMAGLEPGETSSDLG